MGASWTRRRSSRRRLEAGLGLETWNSDELDVVEAAQDATGGRGVDLVVDTSGAEGAISSGVNMLRRRGRLCAVGVSGRESIGFPWDAALFRAIDLRFGSSYTSWDAAHSLMRSGAVDVEPLTTVCALEEGEDAFRAVEKQRGC